MRNHQTRVKFSDTVKDCVVCGNYCKHVWRSKWVWECCAHPSTRK
jgi:hypothetical protein